MSKNFGVSEKVFSGLSETAFSVQYDKSRSIDILDLCSLLLQSIGAEILHNHRNLQSIIHRRRNPYHRLDLPKYQKL